MVARVVAVAPFYMGMPVFIASAGNMGTTLQELPPEPVVDMGSRMTRDIGARRVAQRIMHRYNLEIRVRSHA